jgi:phosphoribosyl-ATP pyrophosphohydrolase
LQNRELQAALCDKLHEEADEVHAAATRDELVEEIADVQQVIDDLLMHSKISLADLKAVQTKKT